jgi:uncharacterized membrane protein
MALGFGSINVKDKVFGVPLVGTVFPIAQKFCSVTSVYLQSSKFRTIRVVTEELCMINSEHTQNTGQ